ncbi:MAG: peptidyl-tRNA hydrolase [Vulcanimicrobiota bacterium]
MAIIVLCVPRGVINPADFSSLSCRAEFARPVLVLAFHGEYRPGSPGNADAAFMESEFHRYYHLCHPHGLVLDFSRLAYSWGDSLLRLFCLDPDPVLPAFPIAVVAGPDCHLDSLLPGAQLHAGVDEAVAWVSDQAAEYERLDDFYEDQLKMYILVQEDLAPGRAIVAAAHAAVACIERFSQAWQLRCWLYSRFHKVVCRVSQREFEQAQAFEHHIVIRESALGDQPVALAFCPRVEWPKAFRFYRLY